MELCHSFLVIILIVFISDNFLLHFLAEDEAAEHRLNLFGQYFLLCDNFWDSSDENQGYHNEHHAHIADALVVPSVTVESGQTADVNHQQNADRQQIAQNDENVVSNFGIPEHCDDIKRV